MCPFASAPFASPPRQWYSGVQMSLPDVKLPDKKPPVGLDLVVAGLAALWLCLCLGLVAAVVVRLQFM
jgi:hypothetical protein